MLNGANSFLTIIFCVGRGGLKKNDSADMIEKFYEFLP